MALTPVNLAATNVLSTSVRSTWERNPYSAAVLADSPVAYWRLGEAAGTTLVDELSTYNGTYFGATLGATGLLVGGTDTAADFDGSDDYALVDGYADSAAFSVELWAEWDTTPGSNPGLVHARPAGTNATSGADKSIGLWLEGGTGKVWGRVITGDGFQHDLPKTATATSKQVPFHVVLTFDGSNIRLYLDGSEAITPVSTAVSSMSDWSRVIFGSQGTENWDGRLDEVALYSFALSPARIEAHYNAGTT